MIEKDTVRESLIDSGYVFSSADMVTLKGGTWNGPSALARGGWEPLVSVKSRWRRL